MVWHELLVLSSVVTVGALYMSEDELVQRILNLEHKGKLLFPWHLLTLIEDRFY